MMLRGLIGLAIALYSFFAWGLPNLKVVVRILSSRRTRTRFVGGPEAVTSGQFTSGTTKLIDSIESLGFRPLGIKQENRPFFAGQELAFAAPQDQCFASIHRFHLDSPLYYFYTPFQDGAVVLTNTLPIDGIRLDGFHYACLPDRSVPELYAEHRCRADNMTAAGHAPYEDFDQAARLRATTAFYRHIGAVMLERRHLTKPLRNAIYSLVIVVLALSLAALRIF